MDEILHAGWPFSRKSRVRHGASGNYATVIVVRPVGPEIRREEGEGKQSLHAGAPAGTTVWPGDPPPAALAACAALARFPAWCGPMEGP